MVHDNLPQSHRGYPTAWYSLSEGREADHVEISTIAGWLGARLPTIPTEQVDAAAWLAIPQRHLLQLSGGAVFHDDSGELTRFRELFGWYPPDLWRWIIAAQWHLIGNTVPLLGRTVELQDAHGARLLAGRLCRQIMEMAFLQEQRYRPYEKWFGRAFADLNAATTLGPLVDHALCNQPTGQSDDAIYHALLLLAQRHNDLGLTEPVRPAIDTFAVGVNDANGPISCSTHPTSSTPRSHRSPTRNCVICLA